MMKKIIALVLLASLVFALCGCSVSNKTGFENVITFENLATFGATNVKDAEGFEKIRGILVEFHGITDTSTIGAPGVSRRCTANNVLYLFPGNGPWNWMDETAVRVTDRMIDVLIEHFGLDEDIPVVSTGHSMGGAGSLVFAANSRHNITAVCSDSPVCDLVEFVEYRPDVMRGYIRSQGGNTEMSFDDAVKTLSPVHIIDKMPDIPYFIIHGTADTDVPVETNSDVMVELLQNKGYDVTYKRISGMTHVAMSAASQKLYYEFAFANMLPA